MDRLKRQIARQTEWMYSMDGWTDGRTVVPTDRLDTQLYYLMDRQTDGSGQIEQTDRQTDKYTGRQHGWMN